MNDTAYIGVDPGASGGFAVRRIDGSVECFPMPATEGDVIELLDDLCFGATNVFVVVEEVPAYMPGKVPSNSIAKLHANFGFIKGLLMGRLLPMTTVRPQKWQAPLGLGTKSGKSTTVWKNQLKGEAQRRFPGTKVTLKTADALLILDYAVKLNITVPGV